MKKKLLLLLCGVGVTCTLFAQLAAQFSADVRSGCAPIRVVFSDASTGNPDRWKWDLGNGTVSTAKNPSTTYFAAGSYNIKLTVYKGPDSASVTVNSYISVFGLPVIDFSASQFAGCAPLPVLFTDKSSPGSGNITKWQWDFGDGNIGDQKNPAHQYLTSGVFKVTLTGTNSAGCQQSASKLNYITVSDSIRARFNFQVPSGCSLPLAVQFKDASVGNNIVAWNWDFGDGGSSAQQNPSHTYTRQGVYTVKLTTRNASGCTHTIERKNIIQAGSFPADFELSTAVPCTGSQVTFLNTTNDPSSLDKVIWTFSDGTVVEAIDATKIFTTAGTYSVTMEAFRGSCSAIATKAIVVGVGSSADFVSSSSISCAPPLSVSFNSSVSSGTIIGWDFGNGKFSTENNPAVTYDNPGTFTVRLITRSSNGCVDTLSKPAYVKIGAPLIRQVKGLPFRGCFPAAITFEPVLDDPSEITNWSWDFGDGTVSNEKNPSKNFSSPGIYTVKLEVQTSSGCSSTFSEVVQVGAQPSVDFEADLFNVCPSDIVSFKNYSANADEFLWEFGDGNISADAFPVHKYSDTGWMTVTLTAFDKGCGASNSKSRYIYVRPPIARFGYTSTCDDQASIRFEQNSIGTNLEYLWSFGDSTFSTDTIVNHRYVDTGTYTVTLRVSDGDCYHIAMHDVYVLDERADFITKDAGDCYTNRVSFIAEGPKTHPNYIAQYEWRFEDGTIIRTDTNYLMREYYGPTQFTLQLKITDLNGCSDSVTKDVKVRFYGPKAKILPRYQAACAGSVIGFDDVSHADSTNPINKWTWDFGNGSRISYNSPPFTHLYEKAGFYDLKLLVEDGQGCKDSVLVKKGVGIYKPRAGFSTTDTLVCIGAPVVFENESFGADLSYQWSFDNGDSTQDVSPTTRYLSEGIYDITLAVTDSVGCSDTLLKPKYITVGNAKAAFSVSDSFTTCPPLVTSFTNQSKYALSNTWFFGNGNSSTLISPSHTYTLPGTFTAKLVVSGNGGCADSVTRNITIEGPSGTFSYAPLTGCPPLNVDFKGTTINTKFYTWDFSDGESERNSASGIIHTYQIPGNYLPKLILEDGKGCKLPVQGLDTIKVYGARAYIKKLSKFTYCDTASIAFLDSTISSDRVTRYRWRFGDGTESAEQNPVHLYAGPGRYLVTLEVWTESNCYTADTIPQPIVVAQTPEVDFGPENEVCVPAQINFSSRWLNADTSTLVWNWNFGNGLTSNQADPIGTTYLLPGTYTVGLTATNNYGCASIITKNIVVNDTPHVDAGLPAYLCLGATHTLQAQGASNYQWNVNNALSCLNCDAPIAKPASHQIFKVTGTDSKGCKGSDTVLVRVKQPGKLTNEPGDTICNGQSFQLRAAGFEVYQWTPAASLSNSNISNPVARPNTTTTYTVVVTDSLNCFSGTAEVTVVVYPIPEFNILESNIVASVGDVIKLSTTSSPDVIKWRWTPPVNIDCNNCPEPTVTVKQKITYTAEASNLGRCLARDEVTITPVCGEDQVFVPNTFSPNGDGNNDVFYPRGRGPIRVKNLRIYSRWGELMYERSDFALNDPTAGWDGTYRAKQLTPDVYVYIMDVICSNNELFSMKGNVTLLR